jgi:hypothetical protein
MEITPTLKMSGEYTSAFGAVCLRLVNYTINRLISCNTYGGEIATILTYEVLWSAPILNLE